MTGTENGKHKGKRAIISAVGGLLIIAAALSAFTTGGGSTGSSTQGGQTVYREVKVERGDIVVGVTENSSATLKTRAISFGAEAEIEEILVKAGQKIKAGQELVRMSADSIQEKIDDLEIDLREANLDLSEAKINQQKGQLSGKNSLSSTKAKAETADTNYELTIEKLELAVKKAEDNVTEIEVEILEYTTLLRYIENYDEAYTDYMSAKEWYQQAQKDLQTAKTLLNQYVGDKTDEAYIRLKDNVNYYSQEVQYAKVEYEDEGKRFTRHFSTDLTEENDIKEARTDALKKLEDAKQSLKDAQNSLASQTITASQDRETAKANGSTADSSYQMDMVQLANNVENKALAVEKVQKQIDELKELLENNVLYAPCDGLVTSISQENGNTVAKDGTILTVSDNNNVFAYVTIAQDDITNINMGQEASLTLSAFDNLNFTAVVDSITTTPARNASGSASYNVMLKVMGDTSQIFEGMTGSATLITRQQKNVIQVSNRCVFKGADGKSYVKVKNESGELVETPVETGFSDGRSVEIVSGLTEGQTVIIESQVVNSR